MPGGAYRRSGVSRSGLTKEIYAVKINKNVIIGAVVVVMVGLVALLALLVANGPALWEMVLRMHGMR